ncbi:MAG: hypothetical protein AB1861_23550 [Cyanobacteriota bacterium]
MDIASASNQSKSRDSAIATSLPAAHLHLQVALAIQPRQIPLH